MFKRYRNVREFYFINFVCEKKTRCKAECKNNFQLPACRMKINTYGRKNNEISNCFYVSENPSEWDVRHIPGFNFMHVFILDKSIRVPKRRYDTPTNGYGWKIIILRLAVRIEEPSCPRPFQSIYFPKFSVIVPPFVNDRCFSFCRYGPREDRKNFRLSGPDRSRPSDVHRPVGMKYVVFGT